MRPGEGIDHERSPAARVASAPVVGVGMAPDSPSGLASAPTQAQRHCYLGHEHQANLVFAPD